MGGDCKSGQRSNGSIDFELKIIEAKSNHRCIPQNRKCQMVRGPGAILQLLKCVLASAWLRIVDATMP